MTSQERRAREIQSAIRYILLKQWDPIGIADEPAAQDEYDFYIGGVYRLLAQGATPHEVAEHLSSVQRQAMGISRNPSDLRVVAEALCALDVKLGGSAAQHPREAGGEPPSPK